MEIGTWNHTLPSLNYRANGSESGNLKYAANGHLRYNSGNSTWGSETNERGGMGRAVRGSFRSEGTGVNLWLIRVDIWHKQTVM